MRAVLFVYPREHNRKKEGDRHPPKFGCEQERRIPRVFRGKHLDLHNQRDIGGCAVRVRNDGLQYIPEHNVVDADLAVARRCKADRHHSCPQRGRGICGDLYSLLPQFLQKADRCY